MTHIDHLARSSVHAQIKAGQDAAGCRYRFKTLANAAGTGLGEDFARALIGYCCAQLDVKGLGPDLTWFKTIGPGHIPSYGSDTWNGLGFAEPENEMIFLSAEMPAHRLPEIVAHETFHAVKHRHRAVSVETEREAYDFGLRVAAKFSLSTDPFAKVYIVFADDLPARPPEGSTAWHVSSNSLHRAVKRHRYQDAHWVEYARLHVGDLPAGYERQPVCTVYVHNDW